MKTISDYLILCTEAQTKKALELGAPIEYANNFNAYLPHEMIDFVGESGKMECAQFVIPTAEEMTGWLEKKNVYCDVFPIETYNVLTAFAFRIYKYNKRGFESNVVEYKSRKEAILASIDAALEYLENLKQ